MTKGEFYFHFFAALATSICLSLLFVWSIKP